ncbi:putative transporter [Limisphaera ngatamarikiensis]|uniref:Putative transporter n=1 Tax=Limisphaera ngatamarikiensis TaxID=1324935 RepID=A0A6M1S0F0_9BACT|nr:putative transporter [Limisphaera ngatamarikiensis]
MLGWWTEFQQTQPTAHALWVLSVVGAMGLALGSVRFRGLSLGVAGTLFVGLVFGHLGCRIQPEVRAFVQEFGLILFVYTIGMQVGPGLMDSLRRQGAELNVGAALVVGLGAVLAVGLGLWWGFHVGAVAGLFAGATTNTPALGAAQEALRVARQPDPVGLALPAMAYAVTYPFGIVGIILAMLALRTWHRIDLEEEKRRFLEEQRAGQESLTYLNVELRNPNLDGLTVRQLPGIDKLGVVISRLRKAGQKEVQVPRADTVLNVGDVMVVVGRARAVQQFRMIVGRVAGEDLTRVEGPVTYARVVVTNRDCVGRTLRQLALNHRLGVTVTRLTRADVELPVTPDLRLQYGDMLRLVGRREDLARAAQLLGNAVEELNHTRLVPVFVGIALGILAGSLSVQPGSMPAPVRLGLAGGPLLAAIVLSRLGKLGPLVWYMPVNANLLLRELGIVLFLACVGLRAGEHFQSSLQGVEGWLWMAAGAAVTAVPLLVVGSWLRRMRRMNYLSICGLLAGSMTDPPALAFAQALCKSDAPAVAYSTVYPLTMILRIVVAQLIVLLWPR